MMNRTLVISAVLVAATAVVAAGCGGGGGGDKPLSKAAYAAKADAACAAAQKKGSSLDLSSIEKIAASGDKAKNVLDDLANDIDDLQPPDALKDSASSFVTGLKKEASDFGDMTQAAKDGNEAKVKDIQGTLQSESAATSEDARFVGATGCARLFA
jgi:hypothetical protein